MKMKKASSLAILLGLALATVVAGCGQDPASQLQEKRPLVAAASENAADASKDVNDKTRADMYLVATSKANEALKNGNFSLAIDEANKVIATDNSNYVAYSIKGFAEALNGNIEQGLADTQKSYVLGPNYAANYYNIAMIYKIQGNLSESKNWFNKVLEKDPTNTWSLYGIATINADQGDQEGALVYLDQSIKNAGQDIEKVKNAARTQDHWKAFHGNQHYEELIK